MLPLPLISEDNSIAQLSMLHNARYVLIFLSKGFIQLWDMEPTCSDKEDDMRKPGLCETIQDMDYQPQLVGQLLASYDLQAKPFEYDYQTSLDGLVTVAVVCESL